MTPSATAPHPGPGLYLQFARGEAVVLNADRIAACADALLADPARIPLHVKQAEAFQLCSICPKHGSGATCHAIRPVLAVWDDFDRRPSHEPVTATYRSGTSPVVMTAETTLQEALQFVSTLSLMYYCEVGKKYWRYFYGVHPLMTTDELVIRVFMNMFWACHGDMARTHALIARFNEEITTTTRCQMDRIRLFCTSDSFLNALTLTQIASEFLAMDIEETVKQQMATFEKTFFA